MTPDAVWPPLLQSHPIRILLITDLVKMQLSKACRAQARTLPAQKGRMVLRVSAVAQPSKKQVPAASELKLNSTAVPSEWPRPICTPESGSYWPDTCA